MSQKRCVRRLLNVGLPQLAAVEERQVGEVHPEVDEKAGDLPAHRPRSWSLVRWGAKGVSRQGD